MSSNVYVVSRLPGVVSIRQVRFVLATSEFVAFLRPGGVAPNVASVVYLYQVVSGPVRGVTSYPPQTRRRPWRGQPEPLSYKSSSCYANYAQQCGAVCKERLRRLRLAKRVDCCVQATALLVQRSKSEAAIAVGEAARLLRTSDGSAGATVEI